jgi:hypothetical protein
MAYGSITQKAPGEMGGVKPPKLGGIRSQPPTKPAPVRAQKPAPLPSYMNEQRRPSFGPPPSPTPIKQAPVQGTGLADAGGGSAPFQPVGPTTPQSRAAARMSMYAPGGSGWANFGGAPTGPDPAELGQAVGQGQMPGTGGGFMAPGPPQPGMSPPQMADPAAGGGQIPPDMMQRLQQLFATNPQMLLQALGMA